jgi:hypothetical protein
VSCNFPGCYPGSALEISVAWTEQHRVGAGQGVEIGLPCGRFTGTCPVRTFEAWQAVARRKPPLFRKISTRNGIGDTALHPWPAWPWPGDLPLRHHAINAMA